MLRPDTISLTILLALLTALGPLSTDLYLPSLPAIARLLTASTAEAQLTLSAYLIGFALGQIFYGPISDRVGRKPVLLTALLIFMMASLACAASPTISALIAARFLQALGGSGAIVLARAVVRDLYSGARAGREFSLMGAMMALAPIVAPGFGGLVQTAWGWRVNFIILTAIGIMAMTAVWRLLPETLPESPPGDRSRIGLWRNFAALLRHRSFVAHLAMVATSYAGLFAWISSAAFVLQDLYGLTAMGFGVAFALASLGYMIGTSLAARLVIRLGLDRTMGLGGLALSVGGLALIAAVALHLTSAAALVLPFAFYLAGLGLAMPQALAGALSAFPDHAGAASSLVGFAQQSMAALVGALVGHLLGNSAWPLAASIAIMGCLTLAVWALSRGIRSA